MQSLLRVSWLPLLALTVVPAGCGGNVDHASQPPADGGPGADATPGMDGSSGSDSSTAPDSGSPGHDAAPGGGSCPSSPPSAGTQCASAGLQCEYGQNPNPQCNALFQCMGPDMPDCTQPGECQWAAIGDGPGTCELADAGATCPSTYAGVPTTQACSPEGLACEYAQGTCYCSLGPGPVQMTAHWYCTPTPAGCPPPRPDIGQSCSQAGLSCDYGACLGGAAVVCDNGIWEQQAVACPE
jgi:hypothetical protein